MKRQKRKRLMDNPFIRAIFIVSIITSWLAWDLTQATNSLATKFTSFKPEREYDAVSSATTKVSIVRSNDSNLSNPVRVADASISYQTIEEMVRDPIELAGGIYMVNPGDMVLLKPNIVDADPSGNGEIIDVRVIKALIKIIDEIDPGSMEIVVGEASPVPIDYELEYDEYYNHALWEKLWDVSRYQDLLDNPLLSDINFRLSNLAGIDFVVIDAIGCLDRAKNAYSNGSNFVRMNTILAGADPVAVDHVCARMMGLNPDDVEQITLAEMVGLGTNDPEQIILKGADLDLTSKRFRKSNFGGGEFGQGARTWAEWSFFNRRSR